MATRILSWQQIVQENDPNWLRGFTRPWVYEFSNGRLFYQEYPLYKNYDIFGLCSEGDELCSSGLLASSAPQ